MYRRRAVGAFLLLALLSAPALGSGLVAVKTTDFSAAIFSDWHGGSTYGLEIPPWLAQQNPAPHVAWVAGDIYLSDPHEWTDMKALFAANGIYELHTCLGNHDFRKSDVISTEDLYPNPGESPIDSIIATTDPEFRNGSWYMRNFGPIRALFLNNNYDSTVTIGYAQDQWAQAYPEGNPPGRSITYWQAHCYPNGNPDYTNPDYSGWTSADTTSGQLAWIKTACAGFGGTFLLAFAHRSPYVPCNWQQDRLPDRTGRMGAWALLSRMKVDLAGTGDLHTCGVSEPLYKGVVSSNGTTFVVGRNAHGRACGFGGGQESCSISEDMMIWPKEADLAVANDLSSDVFFYVVFHGNRATINVMQLDEETLVISRRKVVYLESKRGVE